MKGNRKGRKRSSTQSPKGSLNKMIKSDLVGDDMPLIATFNVNPDMQVRHANSIQLEGLVDQLMLTDSALRRDGRVELHFKSRSEARKLIYVMLYFINETGSEHLDLLYDERQNKDGEVDKVAKNWRWAWTTCPITCESYADCTPQVVQRTSRKWGRAMTFDHDGHYLSSLSYLLSYIIYLFHLAKYGNVPTFDRTLTNAQKHLQVNPAHTAIRLALDFTCDAIKLVGITSDSMPHALSVHDLVALEETVATVASRDDHPADAYFEQYLVAKKGIKEARVRLEAHSILGKRLEEQLNQTKAMIIQEQQLIDGYQVILDTQREAIVIGSAIRADAHENPAVEEYVTKNHDEVDSDYNFFTKNMVRRNGKGQFVMKDSESDSAIGAPSSTTVQFPILETNPQGEANSLATFTICQPVIEVHKKVPVECDFSPHDELDYGEGELEEDDPSLDEY